MSYIWDSDKNASNIQKHGISFEIASRVFEDPYRVELYDYEHSDDEERYISIGMVRKVIFVVYTYREENIRIISARFATEKEREIYYGYNNSI